MIDIPEKNLTPAMKQFVAVKNKYPECLVLFRMGDFYETFYEDAVIASKDLEITLTSRGKGEKKAPLAGIPYHALDNYLAKLVKKGHKVAIVEQVEDPKFAKGIVKRDVVRIITPGTIIESSILNSKTYNYLASLYVQGENFALALSDISTGDFFIEEDNDINNLKNKLIKFNPKECLIPFTLRVNHEIINILNKTNTFLTDYDDRHFRYDNAFKTLINHFQTQTLEGFGIKNNSIVINAAGALLKYLHETQFNELKHIKRITKNQQDKYMMLDSSTLRNLEILQNIKDQSKRGTLISTLDSTTTAMGSRLIRRWLTEPLLDIEEIKKRLDCVEFFSQNTILREEIFSLLKGITDIERLISRVNYGSASPRDLISLKASLRHLPFIFKKLCTIKIPLILELSEIEDFSSLVDLLESSIREDAPATIREGNLIKFGFNEVLKELLNIKNDGKRFLKDLEEKEKRKTGIKNLRIGYNRVFGYFLEVSKSNLPAVPDYYIRKQTRKNSERFITEELKIQEAKILGAQEKIQSLEYEIFQDILKRVAFYTNPVQDCAKKIAILDVILSFAKVSSENNYCKPELNDSASIILKDSRHPVVELLESNFVPNDINLHNSQISVITGPNMAGKSTVLRQVALNVLMAQIGCFCACQEASIGIVDRIFTRVGAYDDLTMGQSTFMVEMVEAANILNNATGKSLIILDEIGRGTSTFDGVSLAWSIVEYIYNKIKAKTMFATHYHVLNKLETQFSNIKNYNIAVLEKNEDITFLHKLIEGSTNRSYGIHVAKLAGLPKHVINRAKEIQQNLEEDDKMAKKINAKRIIEQKTLLEMKND